MMDNDTFMNEDRLKEFWEKCKQTFYTEDQVKQMIKDAISDLVSGA